MVKRRTSKYKSKWCLETPVGRLNEVKFGDFSDNREIGRDKAKEAAVRMRDRWMQHADHVVPDQIDIVER